MTKKFRHSHLQKIFSALLLAGLASGVFFAPLYSFAQTTTKDDLEEKIADLERQIAAVDKELNSIADKKSTLSEHIAELQLSRKKLSAQVAEAEAQLKKERAHINTLAASIDDHTQTQSLNRATLARLIREIHAADSENSLLPLLAKGSIRDFMHGYSELPTVFAALGSATRRLALVNQTLAGEKAESEESIKKTLALASQIKSQKSIYDSLHAESSKELKTTAEQEKQYQAQRAALAKLKADFEAELYKYEAGLAFSGFSKSTPSRGSIVMAWPLKDVFVTQLFGKTSASARLYLSGSHSGVDFRASIGTPVYAQANGIIMGTGDTDLACRGASFGKWIYAAYENGLGATYGHLSSISVKTGQKITKGDIIGYSGQTGHSTGPHLHVSVYALSDSNGNTLVDISGKESNACKGKMLVQPRAPVEAYLNLLDYTPALAADKIKY